MKILAVDDDPEILLLVAYALGKDPGFEVMEALGGRKGLETARRERPDAILTDLRMPGFDGMALLAAVREDRNLSDTRVIICSAKRDASVLESLLRAGAAGVIAKPFDPLTLAAEVRRLAARTPD